jgi:hypothetical protein
MKKTKRILGVGVIMLTMLFSSVNVSNANELDEGGVGSNKCVCKMNSSNGCLASNFISFRKNCGSGATDSECSAQQEILYPGGNPISFCEVHNADNS